MAHIKHKVIEDFAGGYRRLDPIPDNVEVTQFYQSYYYDLLRTGRRAPELQRLMRGEGEAESEASWLQHTLYADIRYILEERGGGTKRLIDIGCGTGEFLSFMNGAGWKVMGLEMSEQAASVAKDKGLGVFDVSLQQFCRDQPQYLSKFDVVTALNVLEHVPDPIQFIQIIKKLLVDGGMAVIRVPNDFSEMQVRCKEYLQVEPWWIAIPDHINYFDFKSLGTFMDKMGFESVYVQGDFPMEWFLLAGSTYVGNPDVGNKCHEMRKQFESNLRGRLRRQIYGALASVGVGRNCLYFGKLRA